METTTIKIEGMSCGGCVGTVTRALQQVKGVDKVEVTLDPPMARVVFDGTQVALPALVAAITDAGYDIVA